ncbi:hypothetical protein BKA70DRAFT_1293211 [Coprinopsis sp. MPI-PUGE-AT-0042]|nr:hypothetical protein BKA70DRAFT_1293211 [Coprinopsis sp. MPI-PUGE-AT-0042]
MLMSFQLKAMHSDELTPQRHEKFYFMDGNAVFMTEDVQSKLKTLYCLHRGVLSFRSKVFKNMFEISGGPQLDGMSDESPIVLPYTNITPQKLDNLLTYLYCSPCEHPRSDDFLLDVLDLSMFLDIDDGKKYAIEVFEARCFAFDPVLQFRLARTYGIEQWIEPATRRILSWELSAVTKSQASDIGFESYYEIVRTKMKLNRLRTSMALVAPRLVEAEDCNTKGVCKLEWKDGWWVLIAPHILHPEEPMHGERLKLELEIGALPKVCSKCQAATTEWMDGKGVFDKHNLIIEEGISSIKLMHGDGTPNSRPPFWGYDSMVL